MKMIFSAVLRMNSNPCIKNEILADARMKSANADEIFALPQMKFNPPIRRRGGFHPTKLDFIAAGDFTHPQGWI